MIYHYTSLANLALILDSGKIRFNNLTAVDDMLEGDLFKKKTLAQHIYVSCWTKNEEENVALWKMYTNNSGVRIGLPDNPWKKKTMEIDRYLQQKVQVVQHPNDDYYMPYSFDEIYGENHIILHPMMPKGQVFGSPVQYLPEHELLEKYKVLYIETLSDNKSRLSINMDTNNFGRYKHERWRFQEEYRFVMLIFSTNRKVDFKNMKDPNWFDDVTSALYNNEKATISYFDIDLCESAIRDMEITTGPLFNSADSILLNALIEKYGVVGKSKVSAINVRK